MSELRWLAAPTEDERAGLHRLVSAVVALGGAVGWLSVPSRAEVDAWFDALPAAARFLTAYDGTAYDGMAYDGAARLSAAGYWARLPAAVTRQNAEIRKVMVHPEARGQGLGRTITAGLVTDCRAHGVEVVALDCRGNNHGALAMYADLGFVVSGRRPDWIGVGAERFDQVLLHLDLRNGSEPLVRHGGRREGLGMS